MEVQMPTESFKRAGDSMSYEDEEFDRKMGGDDKIEVRLLIQSWISGSIIGKGGENIKRLRSTYQAHISLPDSRGPERLVLITSEIGKVCEALEDIIPTLTKQLNRTGGGMGGGDEDEHELRLLIHQGFAGKIIGKGGLTIKNLREQTGSLVKIFVELCPKSSDRVVQIVGSPFQISNCVHAIYELILDQPVKGTTSHYNPDNHNISMASKYGGFDEDRGGGSGKNKIGREAFSQGINANSSNTSNNPYPDSYINDDPPNRSSGFIDDFGYKREVSQVSIPKIMAGAILGKGGNRIKQVQHETGTKIKMDELNCDSSERVITIIGTQEQITYAQFLLQMMVRKHSDIAK